MQDISANTATTAASEEFSVIADGNADGDEQHFLINFADQIGIDECSFHTAGGNDEQVNNEDTKKPKKSRNIGWRKKNKNKNELSQKLDRSSSPKPKQRGGGGVRNSANSKSSPDDDVEKRIGRTARKKENRRSGKTKLDEDKNDGDGGYTTPFTTKPAGPKTNGRVLPVRPKASTSKQSRRRKSSIALRTSGNNDPGAAAVFVANVDQHYQERFVLWRRESSRITKSHDNINENGPSALDISPPTTTTMEVDEEPSLFVNKLEKKKINKLEKMKNMLRR